MPKRPLPDDIPEIGYIIIQLGLTEDGIIPGYDYEHIAPEAVLGYLQAFSDIIREDLRLEQVALMSVELEDDDSDDDEDEDAVH